MYYFYDANSNKLNGDIDEAKKYVVGWAEGGCVTKFKIINLKHLEKFYQNLSCVFSKIVFEFPPDGKQPYAVHNGSQGETTQNIAISMKNIDWFEDYYAVIMARSACGFRMNLLPKSAATTQYELYKTSIGLTKILVKVQDGLVILSEGKHVLEAKNFYNQHIEQQFYE